MVVVGTEQVGQAAWGAENGNRKAQRDGPVRSFTRSAQPTHANDYFTRCYTFIIVRLHAVY